MIELKYLRDVQEYTPILAYWCHKEWWLAQKNSRDFADSIKIFRERENKIQFPLSIVAIAGDFPVGTVSLVHNDHLLGYENFTPWVAALYVIPEYRKQGVAQRLLKCTYPILLDRGIKWVYLHTTTATGFYLKLGWEIVAKDVSGPWGETTIMRKDLFAPVGDPTRGSVKG